MSSTGTGSVCPFQSQSGTPASTSSARCSISDCMSPSIVGESRRGYEMSRRSTARTTRSPAAEGRGGERGSSCRSRSARSRSGAIGSQGTAERGREPPVSGAEGGPVQGEQFVHGGVVAAPASS